MENDGKIKTYVLDKFDQLLQDKAKFAELLAIVEEAQANVGVQGRHSNEGSSGDESGSYDSGSDVESDEDSQDEEDAEIVGTYPYLNSESEPDDNKFERSAFSKSYAQEVEPITLVDDDDIQFLNDTCEMKCYRCPEGQSVFRDRALFLLHRDRHFGQNHFVCPTCLKPFIKSSLCFSHEIRAHDRSFPVQVQSPIITQAYEYQQTKKAKRKNGNLHPPMSEKSVGHNDNPKLSSIPEEVENEFEQGTLEDDGIDTDTDEDDPNFYPNHAVPSTTLYAYRGPELLSLYDCYEVHLKFGRRKRTAANTISRCVLAHRQKLILEGRIAESDKGRYWKPQQNPNQPSSAAVRSSKRKRDHSDSDSTVTNKPDVKPTDKRRKKVPSCADADSSSAVESTSKVGESPRRKRRKKSKTKINKSGVILNREFVSSLICRVCQLCQFSWETEDQLRLHRDEKHPNKKVLDLMTVVKKVKRAQKLKISDDENSSDGDTFMPVASRGKKRKRGKVIDVTMQFGPPEDLHKEAFLASLELVSIRKLALLQKRKKRPAVKFCYVGVDKLPKKDIPRNGRVYVCQKCNFFAKTRVLVASHEKIMRHQTKKKKNKKEIATKATKPKKKAKSKIHPDFDRAKNVAASIVSSSSSISTLSKGSGTSKASSVATASDFQKKNKTVEQNNKSSYTVSTRDVRPGPSRDMGLGGSNRPGPSRDDMGLGASNKPGPSRNFYLF